MGRRHTEEMGAASPQKNKTIGFTYRNVEKNPVFIEAKDDGGGGGNWTTGAISRAKLQSNHHHQHNPGSPGKWPLKRREINPSYVHLIIYSSS